MTTDSAVQETWLRLLWQTLQPGEIHFEKLGDGYSAVVAANGTASVAGVDGSAPHPALESRIPHLERTRAGYLEAGSAYHLPGSEPLRQ